MRYKSFAVPLLIILSILMFIIPIPGRVLDIFLATSLILSVVILLNTVYLKKTLELSIFPSIIVILTIYRLSLNVSTTRLILSQGEAGTVIKSFGNFVGGGNVVVGFVIFGIIMLVNFLVITKGTERVAEVAARFTLDAMPGKQMAIDADLNSGIINEMEARERRMVIQQEADFYGAMDGATKFVKGDAIAGILITILNIVGGIIRGMVFDSLEIMEVVNKYTILTIGDGLVSQLPALMISSATSFIVTKAGTDETDISGDLLKQLFKNPKVMFIAAGLSIVISTVLTFVPFAILAVMFFIIGMVLRNMQKDVTAKEETEVEEVELDEIRKPENVVSLLQVDPIELEFGYGIIPLADVNQGGDLLDRVVMIRRQLALEMGIIVPIIRLRDNIQLSPNEYVIKIKGVEIEKGEIMFDHYLAMDTGAVEEEIEGIRTVEPAFGLPAIWINENQRERAETVGYTIVDPPSIIATHLTEVIKRHSHELTGRQEVQTLINNVKQNYPAIVEELVPKVMSVGDIQKVLANLLKEGVPIRDMVTILETLADFAPYNNDADVLTEYVRQALGRSICKKFIEDGKSNVITLDPKVEQMILESIQKNEYGSQITLEPSAKNSILNSLKDQIEELINIGQQPVVITSPLVRLYFKRITERFIPGLIVISHNELDPDMEIKSIGMVSIQ